MIPDSPLRFLGWRSSAAAGCSADIAAHSARISARALAARGQSFGMAAPSIAANILQTFNIRGDYPFQIPFYFIILFNNFPQSSFFFIIQISHSFVSVNSRQRDNFFRQRSADAIDIS